MFSPGIGAPRRPEHNAMRHARLCTRTATELAMAAKAEEQEDKGHEGEDQKAEGEVELRVEADVGGVEERRRRRHAL